MKYLVVFACFLVAIAAISDEQAWADFKQDFSKQYRSLREEKLRYQVFKSNLATINEHNARYENGQESYTLGINQFADLTSEEFKEKYLNYHPYKTNFIETFEVPEKFTVPESVDWREKAVLSIKDQGDCGSCWAFSVIGAVEGQNAIKHNVKTDLSEQELVDCDNTNNACRGGVMRVAFEYIKENGISTLSSYPYAGKRQTCGSELFPRSNVNVTGYKAVPASERALQVAVASVGPISVGIVGDKIQLYKSGVFDDALCGTILDHAVLAVGYGTDKKINNNKQYWLIKNSWGSRWGEQGYIRMTRNKFNQCGIALDASYPIIA